MRRIGALDEPYPDADAKCTRFTEDGEPTKVLMTFNQRLDGRDGVAVASLLVHEAVHAWQYVLEDIGQRDKPGREIEAYALQAICIELLDAYRRTRVTSSSAVAVGSSRA